AYDVVDEGPEEVLADGPQRATSEREGLGEPGDTAPQEDDVGSGDGDVGARADGDADVGQGEGGSVVDAVTNHGADGPLVAIGGDDGGLVRGAGRREDGPDAELVSDGPGGALAAAGDHGDVDAHGTQAVEGLTGFFRGAIGDGDEAGKLA